MFENNLLYLASDVVKHQTEPQYNEQRRTGSRKQRKSTILSDNYSNGFSETFTNTFDSNERQNGDDLSDSSLANENGLNYKDQLNKNLPNSEPFNRESNIDLAKLDNDNFINRNERNDDRNHVNYLSSLDNLDSSSNHNLINSSIKLWNEKPKENSNYPNFSSSYDNEKKFEHNDEQYRNEQNELDQQDDESYQINQRRRRRRKNLFRARL